MIFTYFVNFLFGLACFTLIAIFTKRKYRWWTIGIFFCFALSMYYSIVNVAGLPILVNQMPFMQFHSEVSYVESYNYDVDYIYLVLRDEDGVLRFYRRKNDPEALAQLKKGDKLSGGHAFKVHTNSKNSFTSQTDSESFIVYDSDFQKDTSQPKNTVEQDEVQVEDLNKD